MIDWTFRQLLDDSENPVYYRYFTKIWLRGILQSQYILRSAFLWVIIYNLSIFEVEYSKK